MEQVLHAGYGALAAIIAALGVLICAFIYREVGEIKANQLTNIPKVEETRENVSRLINGKGVRHDHERALEAIHGPPPDSLPPPAAAPSVAPSIAPHSANDQ